MMTMETIVPEERGILTRISYVGIELEDRTDGQIAPSFECVVDKYLSSYLGSFPISHAVRENIERDLYDNLYNGRFQYSAQDESFLESVLNSLQVYLDALRKEFAEGDYTMNEKTITMCTIIEEPTKDYEYEEELSKQDIVGEPIYQNPEERVLAYKNKEGNEFQKLDFREKVEQRVWLHLYENDEEIRQDLYTLLSEENTPVKKVAEENKVYVEWILANLPNFREHVQTLYGRAEDVIEPYTLSAKLQKEGAILAKGLRTPARVRNPNSLEETIARYPFVGRIPATEGIVEEYEMPGEGYKVENSCIQAEV